MTEREPLNLEQLLEHLGSKEIPGDTQHRYALRRALLKSRCFEVNQITARWLKFFTLTSSAVAGGAVAVAFVVMVQATLNMEINDSVYAAEMNRTGYSLASSMTTSDMRPMDFLNQMEVADFAGLVPDQGIHWIFDQNIDLAFTR